MTFGQGSSLSLYRLNRSPVDYQNLIPPSTGRVPVSPVIQAGSKTAVVVTVGQSLMANYAQGAFAPANGSMIHALDIYNGGVFVAADPLPGCDGSLSNFAIRLADKMITAGLYDRVILVPIAIGGSSVQEWSYGGIFNHRIAVTANRLRSVGLRPDMILWQQGTTDNSLNTSREQYLSRLLEAVATFRFNGYADVPLLVGQESWVSGDLDQDVRSAQRDIVSAARLVFPGPDNDQIPDRYDAAHMNAVGADKQATAWLSSIRTALGI